MEIKGRFDHFNINVTDLERSLAFYDRALGLKEISRKQASGGRKRLSSRYCDRPVSGMAHGSGSWS